MRTTRRRTNGSGFALVGALIVLVVLSSIGGGMLRLTTMQQSGASSVVLGARGEWAAQSGIEWAVFQAAASNACASGTLNLAEGALSGFTVTVACTESSHREGSTTVKVLSIRSEARFGALGSKDFVYREMRAEVAL